MASRVHWEIAKLLEFGVNEELVKQMTADEIKDLLKGIIYLKTRFEENGASRGSDAL